MKKRILAVILATAVTTVGFATPANAAGGWKGPFSNWATCVAASGQGNPAAMINIATLCQQHDDGKWWYKSRFW